MKTPMMLPEDLALRGERLAHREASLAEREAGLGRRHTAAAKRAHQAGLAAPDDAALRAMADVLDAREALLAVREAAVSAWSAAVAATEARLADAVPLAEGERLRRALCAALGAELDELDAGELSSVVGRALAAVGVGATASTASGARPLPPAGAPPRGVIQEAELLADWPDETVPPGSPIGAPADVRPPPLAEPLDETISAILAPRDAAAAPAADGTVPATLSVPDADAADAAPEVPWETGDSVEELRLSRPPGEDDGTVDALLGALEPISIAPRDRPLPEPAAGEPDEEAPEDDDLEEVDSWFGGTPWNGDGAASVEVVAGSGHGAPDLPDASWAAHFTWEGEADPTRGEPPASALDALGFGDAFGRERALDEADTPDPLDLSMQEADERVALSSLSADLFEAVRADEAAAGAGEWASADQADPFADLAAELAAMEPDVLEAIEPIPGYDLDDRAAAAPVPVAPAAVASPAAVAPSAAPEALAPPPSFRRSLGRAQVVNDAAPQRSDDARFALLAAPGPDDLGDPWSQLDIVDLRSTGHPGPLPAPRTPVAPPAPRAEQPRGPRAHLAVKVGMEQGHHFFTGFSGNISGGGLFVATPQALPIGTEVDLFFEMPDGHSVSVRAEVRWVRGRDPSAPESPQGVGLAFLDLGHDDEVLIERWVTRSEPAFHAP